ncbi:MAG: Holliday junction branch migration protein RuvA [Rhodobacteraceae bacterium]|nr:Holliday junction branch migration protein RuvA [Paracoccaceae bacterium]
MIGKLTGRVDYRAADHVLLDVSGVGYTVYCSDRTLAALPPSGQMVALYTDLIVREDLLQLFGFQTLYDREWHRLLLSVQGIGARASMAILGTVGAEGIAHAIAIGDWAAVKAAPGVGPKIAQRVVNELKDKAPATMALGATPVEVTETTAPAALAPEQAAIQAEAISALQNLGYGPSEAARTVAIAAREVPEADAVALIRAALRLLAPKE